MEVFLMENGSLQGGRIVVAQQLLLNYVGFPDGVGDVGSCNATTASCTDAVASVPFSHQIVTLTNSKEHR